MTDQDPPLYDALRALHRLGARHRLREDHVPLMTPDPGAGSWQPWPPPAPPRPEPHPHAADYGLPPDHVYASDDDLAGPPSPPLGDPPAEPGVELRRCACGEQIVRARGG